MPGLCWWCLLDLDTFWCVDDVFACSPRCHNVRCGCFGLRLDVALEHHPGDVWAVGVFMVF